jgi:SHAQKYF class myb-like DNA-binding protein
MSKRRPQQELHSFGEPAAKTRRRRGERGSGEYEYDFDITQTENQNKNGGDNQDGKDNNSISDGGGGGGVWNEEQHKNFVSSIFEIGLKNASPAIILENMTQKVDTMITSERVKSKLQKYRSKKNKEKSKQEFMTNYCEFLQRIKSIQATTAAGSGRLGAGIRHRHDQGVADCGASASSDPILLKLLEDIGSSNPGNNKQLLLGGNVAGYLTYCVMKENKQTDKNCIEEQSSANNNGSSTSSTAVLPTNVLRKGAREYVDNYAGCAMQFPILTEIEKKSSLGIAMTFIAGLFLTMSQHLTRERARAETIGLKLSSSTKSISNDADVDVPDGDTAPKNR